MGIRQILALVAGVLLRPARFWQEVMTEGKLEEGNPMREYAVAVIAVMQLFKFPVIAEPRPAMLFAIFSFVLDIAALYLLCGLFGASSFGRKRKKERNELRAMVPVFALTPFWLSEPLFFADIWGLFAVSAAVLYVLLLSAQGLMSVPLDPVQPGSARGLWLVGVSGVVMMLVFMLQRAVIHFIIFST
ncbi:hypothetical protein INT08_05510 [Prosthecochloris sp. N3]|uniref:Yip1 domain-containing protein n=1 Tax=Prosthecochloris ethylica TaxID=2743976 RepID=A0ABR9XRW3_9CHLB|nr:MULTISPECIES: hypothetical protein [Prosthecochloris]MBF0586726.1 hypothetical protein [Prosthecochloris ethylica]MBF0636632.1 hypothetical protein [Prosthecochloris ethylica]NUK47969.1 hypothetical protein [Prosthecochloris ethylica]RNA65270.1 hypothetical protein CR163_008550 [Prosthecochloris sp. ZM_2]